MREVQGEPIGFLVVAGGRKFAHCAARNHAAVELSECDEQVRGHPVVDDRFDGVVVRCWKPVFPECFRRHDPVPLSCREPGQLGSGRFVRFTVLVDNQLRGLPRFVWPVGQYFRTVHE